MADFVLWEFVDWVAEKWREIYIYIYIYLYIGRVCFSNGGYVICRETVDGIG